jgi:O-antigen/teichoic acid export membrane protein
MTTSEYGLIGIVLAIVSIVGTYQHLGLGIGTLREIAIARDIDESSKIFVTSISARLAITIPIALGLYFLAPVVAIGIYNQPELIFGIKITSFIILANGIQEIGFNVLNGLQKFKKIFILQIVNSSFNMVLIIGMILLLKYNGYFVGNLITTIIFCLIFIIYTYLALEKKFIFPPRTDFIRIFKSIFGIGLFIYLAKIMFGFFSQSGILFLGYFSNNTEVGYLRFTIGYGSYILAFSNAVNFINLTIMSKKYRDNFESYKKDLKDNFTSLFFGTFFLIVIMVLFSKEAILIMAGSPYLTVQPIIIISVFIFFIHMLFELICTMTFLSTDDRLGYIFSYIVLTIVSTFAIFLFMYFGYGKIGALFGMLLGTLAALIFSTIRVRVKMNFWVFNGLIGLLILVGIPILVIGELDLNIYIRITAFIIFSITFWLISKKFNVINIIEILKNSFSKVKLSLVTKK